MIIEEENQNQKLEQMMEIQVDLDENFMKLYEEELKFERFNYKFIGEGVYKKQLCEAVDIQKFKKACGDISTLSSINLIRELFTFSGLEGKITEFIVKFLEKDDGQHLKLHGKNISFILFNKLKDLTSNLFKKFSLRNPFKPESKELLNPQTLSECISNHDSSEKSTSPISKLRQVNNIIEPLILKVVVKGGALVYGPESGLELLRLMDKVLENVEDLLNFESKETRATNLEILEQHFLRQTIVINELVTKYGNVLLVKTGANISPKQKKAAATQNKQKKKENSTEGDLTITEESEENDYKKQALSTIIHTISTVNKIFAKHKVYFISKESLEGLLQVIAQICKKNKEYSNFFVEKNGLAELLKLRLNKEVVGGVMGPLQLIVGIAESIIIDDEFLKFSYECEIKKFVYDRLKNNQKVDGAIICQVFPKLILSEEFQHSLRSVLDFPDR